MIPFSLSAEGWLVAGYVFLSYSHDDITYAATLADHLREKGLTVWVDEQIRSGERWDKIIKHKIDDCGAFIVIMSPAAEDSRWVPAELDRAIDKGKPILPLLLEGEVIFGLGRIQYVDVRSEALPPDQFVVWLRETCEEPESSPTVPTQSSSAPGPEPIGAPPLAAEPATTGEAVGADDPRPPAIQDEGPSLGHGPMVAVPRIILPPSLRGGGGGLGIPTAGELGDPRRAADQGEPHRRDDDHAPGRPEDPPTPPRPRPWVPKTIQPPPPPPGTPPVVTRPRSMKPPDPPSSVDPSHVSPPEEDAD
jgi:hypothetical protein